MKTYLLCLLTVWIGWVSGSVPVEAAVDFRAGVNRDTITIGDPIVFRMRLVRDADDVTSFEWDGHFLAPLEVLEKKSVATKPLETGRVQETTDVVLSIYDVGQFEIPAVNLRYVLANGDSGRVASQPIPIVVRSVKAENEFDIRDIKPPVAIEAQIPLWFWLVVGGFVVLLVLLIWWWRKRKARPQVAPAPPPIDWLVELQTVADMGLVDAGRFKEHYSLLSDIVRRCLEAKTQVRAVEETTFEIARDLRRDKVDETFVKQIEGFLSMADMVKFAKFKPSIPDIEQAVPQATAIVNVLVQASKTDRSLAESGGHS